MSSRRRGAQQGDYVPPTPAQAESGRRVALDDEARPRWASQQSRACGWLGRTLRTGLVPAAAKALLLPGCSRTSTSGTPTASMLVLLRMAAARGRPAPDVAFEEAVKRAIGVRRADVRDLLPTPAVA